jgi:hypothetical protein
LSASDLDAFSIDAIEKVDRQIARHAVAQQAFGFGRKVRVSTPRKLRRARTRTRRELRVDATGFNVPSAGGESGTPSRTIPVIANAVDEP